MTFVGNLPNNTLPQLYRAADVFVTCSTSETYGLTVLEALACGTPVVLPHCGVFDELWIGRIPDAWIYDEGEDSVNSLQRSLRVAGARDARRYLVEHPIKASWEDATTELLEQYEDAIEANLDRRGALAGLTSALDSLVRVFLLTFGAWWLMRAYTNKVFAMVLSLISDFTS